MSLANGMRNGRGGLQICITIYFPIRARKLESSQILSFLKARLLLEFDLRMELADGKNTELGEKRNFWAHLGTQWMDILCIIKDLKG